MSAAGALSLGLPTKRHRALNIAHNAKHFYSDTIRSTIEIDFMGTSHCGIDFAPWTALLSNIINNSAFGQGISLDFLRNLGLKCSALAEISQLFVWSLNG
jgi:hypothetical protein